MLKIGSNSTVDSTNPFVAINQDSGSIFQQMYPFLIQYDSKTLDFAPDFATKWEESTDGLTWTFHTTPSAVWSDGTPLTAADAAWTLSTILKFKSGATANVAGDVAHMTGAKATNADTVVLTYAKPVANVLANLSAVTILPEHIWAPYATGTGAGLKTYPNAPSQAHPVVSGGPFVLVEYEQNQQTILQANPKFYGPKPIIEGFGLQYFTNSDAEIQALKNGDIDATENVPATSVKTLTADTSLTVYHGPGIGFKDLIINSSPKKTDNLELQNPLVKEAMEYAIDRNQIVQTAWLGYATPGRTIVTNGTPEWQNSQIKPLPFNIDKANQLLDQAGYARGSDGIRIANGHPMSYQVLFASDETGEGDRAFTIIQNGFRQIGINIQQHTLDDDALNTAIYATNNQYTQFDLAMWDWTDTGIDPDFILAAMTCAQWGNWSDSATATRPTTSSTPSRARPSNWPTASASWTRCRRSSTTPARTSF